MKAFEGKTAFVTGAAQGIGLAIAKAFLKQGMQVPSQISRPTRLKRRQRALAALVACCPLLSM